MLRAVWVSINVCIGKSLCVFIVVYISEFTLGCVCVMCVHACTHACVRLGGLCIRTLCRLSGAEEKVPRHQPWQLRALRLPKTCRCFRGRNLEPGCLAQSSLPWSLMSTWSFRPFPAGPSRALAQSSGQAWLAHDSPAA